jgi:hypothetical protein
MSKLIPTRYGPDGCESISRLNSRSKWAQSKATLCVGDLAWILDVTTPRGLYPLARVVSLNYSDDGVPRSAVIRTRSGVYTRPLVRLIPVKTEEMDICSQSRLETGPAVMDALLT